MKKSIKKYLILALVVATVILTSVCVASAANNSVYYCSNCKAIISPVIVGTHAPTCENEGYSDIACNICNKTIEGVHYNIVPALGHNMGEKTYVAITDSEENITHFELTAVCARKDCGYTETALDKKGSPIKYYRYEFINEYGKVKEYAKDYPIVKIPATSDKSSFEPVEVYCQYVEASTPDKKVTISGSTIKSAVRPADKAFGEYDFLGWQSENDTEPTKVIEVSENPAAINTYYAKFNGNTTSDVTYTVNFYSDKGYVISQLSETVAHGRVIADMDSITWDKADDVNYRYEFAGWVWMTDRKTVVDKDFVFYGAPGENKTINLVATYTSVAKKYRFSYCYADGTPIMLRGSAAIDEVTNGMVGSDKMNPDKGIEIITKLVKTDNKLRGYSDKYNNYIFTGKWIIEGNNGRVLDLYEMNLTGLLDTEEFPDRYYTLVPQYEPITRLYDLNVKVYFGTTKENHDSSITITITNTDGDFINSVTLNDADVDDDGFYNFTAKLPYAERYNVSVVSESYTGYVINDKGVAQKPSSGYDNKTEEFSDLVVEMRLNEKEPCDCICHGFLQPVVVKIYNIINSLFKKKIVCCDDMYATIGHKLNYKY